jgi:hypothetical protein
MSAVYELEGTLLEACSCNVLCPCWIGEDPDGEGWCDSVNAYRFDRGSINGVDISGLSVACVNLIPGNVLTPASWRQVMLIDDRATDEQFAAIRDAFQGKLGGPLGDLAGLVAEWLAVERAPIRHETRDGQGVLEIGATLSAQMHPYKSASGATTTLRDTVFSTVPGSPAYVAVADHFRVKLPDHGMDWSYEGRNAIQSDWALRYEAA